MKKEELIQSVKIIALGLVISVCFSFVHAAWVVPSGAPSTSTNVSSSPVNAGLTAQTKTGDLSVANSTAPTFSNALDSSGNNSVNIFTTDGFTTQGSILATGNSSFLKNVAIGGSIDNAYALKVYGNTQQSTGKIFSSALAGDTTDRALCVDSSGKLIKCTVPTASCGTAATIGTLVKPTSNLCVNSTATAVTPIASCSNYAWQWDCLDENNNNVLSSCSTKLPSSGTMTFTVGSYVCPAPPVTAVNITASAGGGGGAGEAMLSGTAQDWICPSNYTNLSNDYYNVKYASDGSGIKDMGWSATSAGCPANGTDTKFNGTTIAHGGWHGIMGANDVDLRDANWGFPGIGGVGGSAVSGITGSTAGGNGGGSGIGWGGGGAAVPLAARPTDGTNYGGGGSGGSGHGGVYGGGGGAGSYLINKSFTISKSTMNILVGSGGKGGNGGGGGSSGGSNGNSGAGGWMKIVWP
ncbi:MAG: hypothetical protein WCI41_01385 [bacterium]